MLALLILPILVSGFIVISINPKQKLKLHRYEGQLLYFKAAKIGVRYFLIVTAICLLMKDVQISYPVAIEVSITDKVFNVNYEQFEPTLITYVARKFSALENSNPTDSKVLEVAWLITLSVLTIASAYFVSWLYKLRAYVSNLYAMKVYGSALYSIQLMRSILIDSPLDYIVYQSFTLKKPILVSLKNRKVYVGMVNNLAEPSESEEPNQEISLIPAMSGYRHEKTLKVDFENDYQLDHITVDSSVVIKVDQIETISWFNYKYFEGVNGNLNSNNDAEPDSGGTEDVQYDCGECKRKTKFKFGKFSIVKD